MSCYIYFYLKKKDTPMDEWHLKLAHLCTSDARELSDELLTFGNDETYNTDEVEDPTYGHAHKLSDELLTNTINYFNSKASEMKESKAKYEEQLRLLNENYLKAANKIVLDDIKENISNCEQMITWCDEELQRYVSLAYYIAATVRDVLGENNDYDYDPKTEKYTPKNAYELVYYMG